jgi:hypothetical protein
VSSFKVRASIVMVGLVGFALGTVVRGDGIHVRLEGKSIVVHAGRDPLLVVGGARSDKSPIEPGFQVTQAARLTLPRETVERVVVYKLTAVSWCNSEVCEPCKPDDPYACTVVRTPPFKPIVGTLLEPPPLTPKPADDPFDPTPTATATATATSAATRSPK